MNDTSLVIWRLELLQVFSSILAESCSSSGSTSTTKNTDPDRNRVTMLPTRFVLSSVESFMIGRFDITIILRYMKTISSSMRAVPTRRSDSRREPGHGQTHRACQLARTVFGLLDFSKYNKKVG